MNNRTPLLSVLFVALLFVFSAFMIWYLPSMSSVRTSLEETRLNLETSQGRENKQQDEYDKAVQELPLIQAELSEKGPLAEQAEENIAALKDRRKELRSEKEELEKLLFESGTVQEEDTHE